MTIFNSRGLIFCRKLVRIEPKMNYCFSPVGKKVLAGLDPQLPKAGLPFETSRGCTKGSVRGSGRRAAIISCFPENSTEVTNNYLQQPISSLRH